MIWDRSYNDVPYMTTADVQISDSDGLLIVGQTNQDAVYRVVEPDGFNSLYLTLRTNSFESRFHAVYPIGGRRLFVQCNTCWVQVGDNVTRLYSATESGLGGYVVPPGPIGYAIPMQVQQDGSIVGGAARHTAGSRHGWVVDKWRWGATAPEWSSDVIMATVDGQTSGGFFPSNMRVNRTDRLLPAGSVLIQPNFPQVQQPFWFALTPTGVPLWLQTTEPLRTLAYLMDDAGDPYFVFSVQQTFSQTDIVALRGRSDGSIAWSRDLGTNFQSVRCALPFDNSEFWVVRSMSRMNQEWVVLDKSTGAIVRRVPIALYGRTSQSVLAAITDEFGSPYVLWRGHDGPIDNPSNEHAVLVKYDSLCRPIWVWEVHADPNAFFVAGRIDMRDGVGYYVAEGAQRIIKFRIRAAFVEGDASGDGCIDDKDLAMTLEAFGTNDPSADFDSNGIVDDRDLDRVLRNFGLGCGG